jgi:peroxiredoxin
MLQLTPILKSIGLGATAAILALAATAREAPAQGGGLRQRFVARFLHQEAPDFELPDLSGKRVRLSGFRGRPVLVNFWYSSCIPCRAETPDLARLYEIHRDRGLVVLGINLDDVVIPRSEGLELQKFLKQIDIPYPILRGNDEVFNAYGQVPAQPTTFLVDREGIIAEIFWGARPGQVFDSAVRPYLADGKPSRP